MASFKSLRFIFTTLVFCNCGSQNFTISPLPLPQKTWSHASAIYNNTLTILNGADSGFSPITGSFSLVLEPAASSWKQHILTLPLGITGILVEGDNTVQVDDKLYIINPDIAGNTALQWNILLVYDLLSHSYTRTATPLFLASFACSVYNRNQNIIYIIGGIPDDIAQIGMNQTQTYNISNSSFALVSDIVIARGYSGCAMDVKHEHIFLFGGARSRLDFVNWAFLDSIEKYSVSNDKWTVMNQTLTSRKANIVCTTLAVNNNIYCSSNGNDRKWEVFNADTFVIGTTLINVPREFSAVSVWQETCLFATGGIFVDDINAQLVLQFLNSSETFGICPPPTYNPTMNPTSTPTKTPWPTFPTVYPTFIPTNGPTHNPTNDISECFIGGRCSKTEDCCPNDIDERENGITCRCEDIVSYDKSKMFCCIKKGYYGCLDHDNCCGERSVCYNHECVKDGDFLSHDHDTQKRETEHVVNKFDSLEDIDSNINMALMFVVCLTCVVSIIIACCVCIVNIDDNNNNNKI